MCGKKMWANAGAVCLALTLAVTPAFGSATPIDRQALGTMEYEGVCGDELIAFEAHNQTDGTWRFTFLEKQGTCDGVALQFRIAPGSPEEGFHGGIESVSSTPWMVEADGTFQV